jgi:hypothetical protein
MKTGIASYTVGILHMKDIAMIRMLAMVIFAMVESSAAAQTNSYTNMLNTIQMQNQSWYNQLNSYNRQFGSAARSAVQPGQAQQGAAAGQQQLAPGLPQYPITATDFYSLPGRVMPDHLANEQAALTPEQKTVMRVMYSQLLDDFEKANRKNNMAAALTFAVRASLRAVYGKQLSQAEINQLGWNFNSVLAANPQFITMPPKEKQVLYESLIITGGTIAVLETDGVQQNNLVMQEQAKELGQGVLKQWLNI